MVYSSSQTWAYKIDVIIQPCMNKMASWRKHIHKHSDIYTRFCNCEQNKFFHSIVFVFLPTYIIHNVMFSINIIFKILLNVLSVMGFLVMHDPYKSKKGIFGIFGDTEVDIYRNSFWSELFSVNVNFDSAKECWKKFCRIITFLHAATKDIYLLSWQDHGYMVYFIFIMFNQRNAID